VCDPEEIRRMHRQTNDEIRYTLAALNGYAEARDDKELETLVMDLRQVLAKRFLINGIADWQREE
jgi:hypothetical protein